MHLAVESGKLARKCNRTDLVALVVFAFSHRIAHIRCMQPFETQDTELPNGEKSALPGLVTGAVVGALILPEWPALLIGGIVGLIISNALNKKKHPPA